MRSHGTVRLGKPADRLLESSIVRTLGRFNLPLFAALCSMLTVAASDLRFTEGAREAGLNFQRSSGTPEKKFIIESMSGGVALFDYNGDGRLDIYFVNGNSLEGLRSGSRTATSSLFRNKGDGTFEDVTKTAGAPGGRWDMGAVAADIDNDGDPDLFVTGYRENHLYENRGDGTFADITAAAGLESGLWSTGAAFGDFDNDGLLDLAVARYVEFDIENPPKRSALCRYRGIDVQCGPRGLPGQRDALYRNVGNRQFRDVSQETGFLTQSRYYGLGISWADYDNDGDADIFVANDSCPNFLFRNDSGRFSEVAMETGIALDEDGNEQAGMGINFGDPDNDGWLDVVQTNFSDDKNTLYSNQQGFFLDSSYRWGIGEISWQYLSWGTFFFDADLDGLVDLFVVNGHVYPEVDKLQIGTRYRQREFLFQNVRGQTFKEVGEEAGITGIHNGRGAAYGDLDNDGRLDIVVNRLDDSPALYWNRTPVADRSWIGLDLRGRISNRDAVGARVTLTTSAGKRTAEITAGASYLSQNDRRIVFGLGSAQPTSIEIRWPSGLVQQVGEWTIGSYNLVVEPQPVNRD